MQINDQTCSIFENVSARGEALHCFFSSFVYYFWSINDQVMYHVDVCACAVNAHVTFNVGYACLVSFI